MCYPWFRVGKSESKVKVIILGIPDFCSNVLARDWLFQSAVLDVSYPERSMMVWAE